MSLELNKVYCGDCLELMKNLEDKSIDMILCDLPYGTTECKWDVAVPLDKLWIEYTRITKDNAAIILTAQTPFDKVLGASNLPHLKYEWIWEKSQSTGGLNSNKSPLKSHENILVFYKNAPTYNPQFIKGDPYIKIRKPPKTGGVYRGTGLEDQFESINNGFRYPRSVIRFDNEYGLHPTQKPVALFEYLIRTYTNEGDLVLDNCIGSGTTAIACIRSGRRFIGFEKEPSYFDAAQIRINKAKEQEKLKAWFE